jgi:Zn-dependent peptidase ImmA (M78 family)
MKLSDFQLTHPEASNYLLRGTGKDEFFAMTLCGVSPKVIIYNDGQSRGRTAADIAHELAHLLLLHPPHRLADATGRRHFDAELEAEANWLGPAILVSEEAALVVANQGLRLGDAASAYGVSEELMQMRLNVTGAWKRARRAA